MVLEKVEDVYILLILFPAGSFIYNLNSLVFAKKVFVKSFLPHSQFQTKFFLII